MNSALRVYLYKRCGVEICKRTISNSQSYQFTGYGTSSHWMGWKALQRLYVWLRPQPNSVEQNSPTNIKWANSNLFATCTDSFIRIKLGLWEPDLAGQSQLKENREYNIFLETALFAYRASQDNRRLGQAWEQVLSSEKSKLLHFSAVVVSNNAQYFSRGPENTREGKRVLPNSQMSLVSDPLRKKNQLQEAVKEIRNRQTHRAANTLLRAGKYTSNYGLMSMSATTFVFSRIQQNQQHILLSPHF